MISVYLIHPLTGGGEHIGDHAYDYNMQSSMGWVWQWAQHGIRPVDPQLMWDCITVHQHLPYDTILRMCCDLLAQQDVVFAPTWSMARPQRILLDTQGTSYEKRYARDDAHT